MSDQVDRLQGKADVAAANVAAVSATSLCKHEE